MAFDFSYRFTEKAAQDLDEILEYISITLCNPTAATDFYEQVIKAINQILSFPDAGTPVNNPFVTLTNVRKRFIKNYTLYYIFDSDSNTLVILRIVYSRRNLSKIIHTLKQ